MARLFLLLFLCTVGSSAAALDFVTLLGNSQPSLVQVGADGSIYVAGTTVAHAFPATEGSLPPPRWAGTCYGQPQPTMVGHIGPPFPAPQIPCTDGFVARLDSEGRLIYATYLGAIQADRIHDLDVDEEGHAYVSGWTQGFSFAEGAGFYVLKLSPDGKAVEWVWFRPGWQRSVGPISVARDGAVFVLLGGLIEEGPSIGRLAADGSDLEWSYPFGANPTLQIQDLDVDSDGGAWFSGLSDSRDLPSVQPVQGAYPGGASSGIVGRLAPDGSGLTFYSYIGGSGRDTATAIRALPGGGALITGETDSSDFLPKVAGIGGSDSGPRLFLARLKPDNAAFDRVQTFPRYADGRALDVFVDGESRYLLPGTASRRISADGEDEVSVMLEGGSPTAAALDGEGRLVIAGRGVAPGLSIVGDSRRFRMEQPSAFVTALDFDRESGAPKITGIENAAGFIDGPIAPGEILTLRGRWFAFEPHIYQASEDGSIPAELSGVRVLFDGMPGAPLFVSRNQINVVAPYELQPGATAQVRVVTQFGESELVERAVADAAPALFTQRGIGVGPVIALDAELREISVENPAERGSAVALFATGVGLLDGELPVDRIVPSVLPLPAPVLPVRVEIGGIVVEPEWIGASPTRPAGVIQVNVRIPDELPSLADVPIRLLVGGAATQQGTSIFVE